MNAPRTLLKAPLIKQTFCHLRVCHRSGLFLTGFPIEIRRYESVGKSHVLVPIKGKGKALPITGHEGPEGEQMYSSTLPSTSVRDGDGWSTPRPGLFTPGKDPVPIL